MTQPTQYAPIYFAPDLDPAWSVNPGILTSVTNFVPTKRGTLINYGCTGAVGPSTGTFSVSTYGSPVSGYVLRKVDGTARLFIATSTRIMEGTSSSAFTDRSLGGADYTTNTDLTLTDWCATTYGNDVIFVNKINAPQVINSGSAFANLGGSPPMAGCCTTNQNFVILGNCNGGTDLGDQVWWSGLGNDATWTPSASTQAGNIQLVATGGRITALVNMRDTVVAYKDSSIYVGDYQGSPLLWTWRLVSDRVGCASPHGVAVVNGIHYFVHQTGVYRFDGASVQPVGQGISQFLQQKIGLQNRYARTYAVYDDLSGVILWYIKTNSGATPYVRDAALAFHPQTGKFGYVSTSLEAVTANPYCPIATTLSDLNAWSADAGAATSTIILVGDLSATAGVYTIALGGASATAANFTTGDIGDDVNKTKLTRIKPRLLTYTSINDGAVFKKPYEAATDDSPTTFTADTIRARWDGLATDRWLQATLSFSGATEVGGLEITSVQAGSE